VGSIKAVAKQYGKQSMYNFANSQRLV